MEEVLGKQQVVLGEWFTGMLYELQASINGRLLLMSLKKVILGRV